MNQRSRQNLFKPWQHYRFVLGAIDQEKAQANGLNLVPILLCVNAPPEWQAHGSVVEQRYRRPVHSWVLLGITGQPTSWPVLELALVPPMNQRSESLTGELLQS